MVARRPKIELITGLDIGSTAIRLVVGQLTQTGSEQSELQIIGAVNVSAEGMQKGIITSIEDTISAVSSCLEKTENLLGAPIEHVWVGISGVNILSQESRGVVAVSRGNGEISEEDVERAVEAAKTVASPLNYELLHVLPRTFSVDGQTGIKDPVGMTGMRLEVDTKIIHAASSHIKNLTKAVYRTGLDIDDFVLSILAAGEVVTTSKQRNLGTVVINIGGSTTSMVVYEDGDIIHTTAIPIGSSHITNDLALGLKTSIDVAEQVKLSFGSCMSKGINKREKINLIDAGADEDEEVSLCYIAEIIEARVSEILEKIDEQLAEIERSGLLPAGAIFIGGGSKIRGLVDLAKMGLGLPASLGKAISVGSVADNADDLSFVQAVGLVKWGSKFSYRVSRRKVLSKAGGKVAEKVQKIFKSFIP